MSGRLTPIGGELRFEDPLPKPPRRRGPVRRLREWWRGRTTPKSLAGAIALGLTRLALGVVVLAAAAIWLARLAGRPDATGLFLAGAFCVLIALFGTQVDRHVPEATPELRQVGSLRIGWALAGLALIALGILLDAR